MKTNFQKISISILCAIIIFSPILVFAAQGGTGSGSGADGSTFIVCNGPDCTFNDLIKLGINIINFLIVISIPLAAISFIFAGFKLLTSGGNESALKDAKNIFTKTGIGLVIVLSAWLIVKVLLVSLLKDPSYSILSL